MNGTERLRGDGKGAGRQRKGCEVMGRAGRERESGARGREGVERCGDG